jgi:selenocysteine lyase/cysteine desulfurase
MQTRRQAIGSIIYPAAFGALSTACAPGRFASAVAAAASLLPRADDPRDVARDEAFWLQIQQAFTVDRSIINLNNGGVSPSPAIVQQAVKRHLDHANTCPAHVLWQVQDKQIDGVRRQLARAWGVDAEEIAITRNSSESLQICQQGFDLAPGDEVLTTTHDYPRMITTFKQRARREGIVLKQFPLPIPCEDPAAVVALFEANITPRTRLILMSHIVNITGQILPVKAVVQMARARGIPVIVDGAHALAHFDFKISDLDCDYYGVSLHKWLFAPHGTGLLYVRRDRIASLWPLMAAEQKNDGDIRKFEEIGTHAAAPFLAIAEALAFHQGIGAANKEARLRHLRDCWATRLLAHDRVTLHTSLKPQHSCALATLEIDGIDPQQLSDYLWERHRILTTAIMHDEFRGVRITPSVYTTLPELDRFCEVMETVIRSGLPAAP